MSEQRWIFGRKRQQGRVTDPIQTEVLVGGRTGKQDCPGKGGESQQGTQGGVGGGRSTV